MVLFSWVDIPCLLCPSNSTAGYLYSLERLLPHTPGPGSRKNGHSHPYRRHGALPHCLLPWMRIQNHCITGGETEAWRGERGCPEHHVGSGVSGSGLVWQGKGEKKKEGRKGEGRREEGRGKKKGRIKELSWSHTWQTRGQGQRGPQ